MMPSMAGNKRDHPQQKQDHENRNSESD